MMNRLRHWIEAIVNTLPSNPTVRLVAMLLAAFAAMAGAVKGYREIFPVEKDSPPPPTVQVVYPPVSSPPPTAAASVDKPGYVSLWECIPPAKRVGVNHFDRTPPSQFQLDESVVFWSGNPSGWAPKCLADLLHAGASPDSALSTPVLGYGSGPALHSALNQKQWKNALILLEAGANPNLQTIYSSNKLSAEGELALDMAIGSAAPSNIRDAIRARGGKSRYDKPAK